MLPHRFQFHRPTRLEAVLELLERHGEDIAVYAGGTELLLALKARVLRYEHLVDLKQVPGLRDVRVADGAVLIGALASHHALATDPVVRSLLPAYAELSDNIANVRVRVAGTIGGNLCFAEPHADPPTLLAALDARLTLRGAQGARSVAVADFIEGEFTTVRQAGEVLTEITVPMPPADSRFAYCSFGQGERPAVGIALGYVPIAGRPVYRAWAGAIGPRPMRLVSVEEALAGVPPGNLGEVLPAAALRAAEALPAQSDLGGSADYKRHLATVMMRRAAARLATSDPHAECAHGRG